MKFEGAENMTFGERIRLAREARGMTQKELADAVGMSQPALYNTESGRNKSSTKILDLANALKVSPHWIATGKESSFASAEETAPAKITGYDHAIDGGCANLSTNPDLIEIPYLNGYALSAGTGAVNADLPYDGETIWMTKSLLKRRCEDITKVFGINVRGDSMSPRFEEGGVVIIDSFNTIFEDGKVFAIHYDGQDFIKTLRWMPGGKYLVESENPIYKPFEAKAEDIKIVGRVIAYQREEF